MPLVIVSYDGTREDRDALALGHLFAKTGAELSVAYVRHAAEQDLEREAQEQREAERLLAVAASELDGASIGQHVILNPSTAEGLAALATELGADVIAFGSSYGTPSGRVQLPHTAEALLEYGLACSLALAPAGLGSEASEHGVRTIAVHNEDRDDAARAIVDSLARALGAAVSDGQADLLVVTSRSDAPSGQLLLSGAALEELQDATCPVLALARGASLSFG
jgi:nucleotide-binding universal stress UspA family protein